MTVTAADARMRFYGASDHAVVPEQGRDKTCLMIVGVDEHDQIWVQPDLFWKQARHADRGRGACHLMDEVQAPVLVGRERSHLEVDRPVPAQAHARKTGVLLDRRDHAGRRQAVAGPVDAGPHVDDEGASSQASPAGTAEARDQLLKFPQGAHDDFVDTSGPDRDRAVSSSAACAIPAEEGRGAQAADLWLGDRQRQARKALERERATSEAW